MRSSLARLPLKILSKKAFMFASLRTHYEQLEVNEGAAFKEIREKYLISSKMYHPDICAKAEDRYHDIQRAYKVLMNPQSRKLYDLSLGIQHSPWEKEIIGQKFTSEFQNQPLYDQILKSNKEVKESTESMEQKLQRGFAQEIESFSYWSLFKNWGFLCSMLGLGTVWLVWSGAEIIWLGYTGTVIHKIEEIHTETALKLVPLVSR